MIRLSTTVEMGAVTRELGGSLSIKINPPCNGAAAAYGCLALSPLFVQMDEFHTIRNTPG